MVLLGGLEIVAAGYVLNELHKDNKAAQRSSGTQSEERRRRRKHHHRESGSRPRPPRPSQQSLAPPPTGPPRPSSAPPQQFGPPRINSAPTYQQPQPHLGPPWTNPNQPFSQPPPTHTWPHPPAQQPYHQPPPQQHFSAPHPPPPQPGLLNHTPTMHYDMKTGKWQTNMLPSEMSRSGSQPTTASHHLSGSNRPRPRGQRSNSSSSSSSYGSDSADSDLAYGKPPGRNHAQLRHVPSHERQRPSTGGQGPAPPPPPYVEGDWYANPSQPLLIRENRAATLPPAHELSGTSAPRPGHVELDAETPGRYRPRKN